LHRTFLASEASEASEASKRSSTFEQIRTYATVTQHSRFRLTMTFEVIALLTASLAAATTTLTEEAVKGLLETDWNGTPEERKMIEDKVKQRPVLGSNDIMKRTAYAASPILKHIKKSGHRHCVNVAYVPHLMGKTTACHAIMKKYVKEGTNRGLCFCPNDTSRPYLEHMVTLLGFTFTDTKKPPFGLVAGLLEALDCSGDGLASFLILDDFMPDGPTNIDIDLLVAIKTSLRSRNIIVVVLTASKDSANYMLTMNSLETILPPVGEVAMKGIRAEFELGNHFRRDPSFHLNWESHLSMEWDAKEMRKALLVDRLYEKKSAQEKKVLGLKIDALLQKYTDEERKEVTPEVLLQALDESYRMIQPIETLTSSLAGTSSQNSPLCQETGLFCSGFLVM
jgi:hypothetical protein